MARMAISAAGLGVMWLVLASACDGSERDSGLARHTATLDTAYVGASADTYVRSGTPNQPAGSADFLRLQASGQMEPPTRLPAELLMLAATVRPVSRRRVLPGRLAWRQFP